jgi:hypothetical protein
MTKKPYDDNTPTDYPKDSDTPTRSKKDERSLVDHDYDDDNDDHPWRGGQTRYPPSWTLYEKMKKEEAQYQKGQPFHNCGKCSFYQSGHCQIVLGHISPEMGCRYFQQKYEAQVFFTGIRLKRK